jgi:hypothetical protein
MAGNRVEQVRPIGDVTGEAERDGSGFFYVQTKGVTHVEHCMEHLVDVVGEAP